VQPGGGLGGEQAGGQVRVADLRDEHARLRDAETPTLSPAAFPHRPVHSLWIAHVYEAGRPPRKREYA
jgi:hypothetical protein